MAHAGNKLALHLGRALDFAVAEIQFLVGNGQLRSAFLNSL
jgi:hypothetical protein